MSIFFFFSSRRRHTRCSRDWSSDVCSSDLGTITGGSQTTNASGVATLGSWTLSPTAGQNTLTASSGTLSGSPVTFTATGSAGPAATMGKSSGGNLTGEGGTPPQTPPLVLVGDAKRQPVSGGHG